MMNKKFPLIVTATVTMAFLGMDNSYAACACHAHQKDIQNLDLMKQKLMEYHDSGQYEKDQIAVIKTAQDYLESRLSSPHQKPLAIVLDIDETSLSNYRDMLVMGFGGTAEEINQAEGNGTDPAIQPTLELYRFAKAHDIAVFFVTGRLAKYREATANNLRTVGYKNWDDLILKPNNYREKSASTFKIASRETIEKKGYDIVLNIGDQHSDLVGGFAEKTIKMPNPYYIIP